MLRGNKADPLERESIRTLLIYKNLIYTTPADDLKNAFNEKIVWNLYVLFSLQDHIIHGKDVLMIT